MKNYAKQRWLELCGPGQREQALRVWSFIVQYYGELHREYHTLAHIAQGLRDFDSYFPDVRPHELLAWFFHDIFYLPGCQHNEQVSTQILHTLCYDLFTLDRIQAAAGHILATHSHSGSMPTGTQRICDIDLLILASAESDYDTYTRNIRNEVTYLYPAELWDIGRPKFIDSILARGRIFQTDELAQWFEHAARTNLRRERKHYP